MNDAEFVAFRERYEQFFFEMTAEGDLGVLPLASIFDSARNVVIGSRLLDWADRDKRGYVTRATTGLVPPNGARRSADAAWTPAETVEDPEEDAFLHGCPAFVIERRARWERLAGVPREDPRVDLQWRGIRMADRPAESHG